MHEPCKLSGFVKEDTLPINTWLAAESPLLVCSERLSRQHAALPLPLVATKTWTAGSTTGHIMHKYPHYLSTSQKILSNGNPKK